MDPTVLKPPPDDDPFRAQPTGPLALPGTYRVALAEKVLGKLKPVGDPVSFEATPLGAASLPSPDRAAVLAFAEKTARLQRAVLGAVETAREAATRLELLKKAVLETRGADPRLGERARSIEARLKDLQAELSGDSTVRDRNEPTTPSTVERVQGIVYGQWTTTSAPTETQRNAYDIAAAQFGETLARLRGLVSEELRRLEDDAEAAGVPWTPGRIPRWQAE